jgi:hypothetical protein
MDFESTSFDDPFKPPTETPPQSAIKQTAEIDYPPPPPPQKKEQIQKRPLPPPPSSYRSPIEKREERPLPPPPPPPADSKPTTSIPVYKPSVQTQDYDSLLEEIVGDEENQRSESQILPEKNSSKSHTCKYCGKEFATSQYPTNCPYCHHPIYHTR